jgi:lipopolysaccharide transport system permease protein
MMILVEFGVNLWMYATPVVYPLSEIRNPLLKTVVMLNPVTMPVEMVRYTMLGVGTLSLRGIALSWGITAACLLLGIMVFHRVERTFMDTV